MDLIVGVIAAFFLGGVAGWLLRATRDGSADPAPAARAERKAAGAPGTAGGEDRLRWGAAPGTPVAQATPRRAPVSPGVRPGTVLLADDRKELVAVNRAHLERHGYRVLTATDGNAALALARAEHPAVVVLDHSMPGRSGIEVTRALKADPATADIVVLLMTAHSYGAIGATARAAGASGFMSKPCEPSRVLREIAVYAGPAS